MKYPVLVFDLDDTLYAERDYVLSGIAAADRWLQTERAVNGFAVEAGRLFTKGWRGTIFDEALRRLGVAGATELVPKLVEVYRAHAPEIALLPDAAWALEHFSAGRRLGLITDGWAAVQRRKLAALALGPQFGAVVCTDELGRENWKPSRVPFLHLMEQLGCLAGDCVYVGDNPAKDFIAPNALGWLTVRVRRAGGEHAGAEAAEKSGAARHEIASLRELAAVLAGEGLDGAR